VCIFHVYLDPTLEACPALAIPLTYPPLDENMRLLSILISSTIDKVEIRSNQKKKEQV